MRVSDGERLASCDQGRWSGPRGVLCLSGFRSTPLAGIGNTGEDAYATLGLVTCVALRTGEKYHRRPACVLGQRLEIWQRANEQSRVIPSEPRSLLAISGQNSRDASKLTSSRDNRSWCNSLQIRGLRKMLSIGTQLAKKL
jgi:hypothetical protein